MQIGGLTSLPGLARGWRKRSLLKVVWRCRRAERMYLPVMNLVVVDEREDEGRGFQT